MKPCEDCGGGFPGDVPDDQVCKCGAAWAQPKKTGLQRKTPLKQGAGLKRTPINRGTSSLKRTGPITRTAPIAKKTAAAKPRKKTGKPADVIPAAVRAIVLVRCGGLCESCGAPLEGYPVHMHHRRKRNGNNHTPDNLVALHPLCHVIAPLAVHQQPAFARERGLIVLTIQDPATVPLLLPSGEMVLLDPVEPRYIQAPSLYAA